MKAVLKFSNGDILELSEGQLIIPISQITLNGDITVAKGDIYEIWYHSADALIPSICELISKCDFFYLIENPNKIYNSKSIVTIENI